MKETDQVQITWTRVDTTKYVATVSVERYAALIGMDVKDLLMYNSARRAMDDGDLDLADELANVEDSGDAYPAEDECQREEIRLKIRR